MTRVLALLLLGAMAFTGCDQSVPGESQEAASVVADHENMNTDPSATDPTTGPVTTQPSGPFGGPMDDPDDGVTDVSPPETIAPANPCEQMAFLKCYTTEDHVGLAFVATTPADGVCEITVTGDAAGGFDGSKFYGTELPAMGASDEWDEWGYSTLEPLEFRDDDVSAFTLRVYDAGTDDVDAEQPLYALPDYLTCP